MMKVARKLVRTADPIVVCVATFSVGHALNPCAGDSLPARLAVEHCTHEARGLDVLPQTIGRFRNNGDAKTADILEVCVLRMPCDVVGTHCSHPCVDKIC